MKKKTEHKYTASEILDLYDKKRSSTAFSQMVDQMEDDFNLFALEPYEAEKGHLSYTSPKPKNDFLKILYGINKASLTWQVVTAEDAPENERKAANDGESLLTGIIHQANRNLSKVGESTLRDSLAWFGCGRGVAGLKCLIYTNADKETEIDIRPLDPQHMAWERGTQGLVWAAFEYHVSKSEALDRWGIELEGEEDGRVIDFFNTKINAVVFSYGKGKGAGASQFVKPPTLHNLDHVPIWVGFPSGMPTVYNKSNDLQLKHRAASVYASSRGIYEPFNKQVSFMMDTAEKSIAGTLVYQSKEGKKTVKGNPFASWQVISVAKGESITPLMPPKVPPESAMVMSVIDRDKQESTVPYPIGYGVDTGAHSGTALSMLNDNTRSIYDPFCGMLEEAYRWLCEEILSQFKSKGQKMTLRGYNQEGKFFTFDANPADIQDDWYVQVKVEPKLPRDEAGELQMALAATNSRAPSGRPFMSNYTAYEKIIKLQNPDAENTRIDDQMTIDQINAMPQFKIRAIAKALLDKGDRVGAQEFLASIPAPGGQQGSPQGQGGVGQPPMGGGPPGGPVQGQNMPTGGQQGQPLSPQDLEQLAAIAAQMKAQGKPIPPEIAQTLQAAQNMPGPGGPPRQ